MRLTLCFLGSICFCTYANSQFLNITNTNEIPAGWAIVGKTPNSNGTVYTIENLNKYAPDANATIYPIGNTMPVGWQVISISGSNVDNIRWTIKKTKGMAKGSIIMVCMNDRLGSEWEQVSTSSCGNCALLTQTSGVCYTIRKITEGDSPAVNNQNNNNGTSKQVYGGINPPYTCLVESIHHNILS